jgi:hypothetical protein
MYSQKINNKFCQLKKGFIIFSLQISVATVLTNACKTREQQSILAAHGAVRALAGLLSSPHADVQLPALKCLAYMVFGNEQVGTSPKLSNRKSFLRTD